MTYKEVTSNKVLCEPLVHIDEFHRYWMNIVDYKWEAHKQGIEWIELGNDYWFRNIYIYRTKSIIKQKIGDKMEFNDSEIELLMSALHNAGSLLRTMKNKGMVNFQLDLTVEQLKSIDEMIDKKFEDETDWTSLFNSIIK